MRTPPGAGLVGPSGYEEVHGCVINLCNRSEPPFGFWL